MACEAVTCLLRCRGASDCALGVRAVPEPCGSTVGPWQSYMAEQPQEPGSSFATTRSRPTTGALQQDTLRMSCSSGAASRTTPAPPGTLDTSIEAASYSDRTPLALRRSTTHPEPKQKSLSRAHTLSLSTSGSSSRDRRVRARAPLRKRPRLRRLRSSAGARKRRRDCQTAESSLAALSQRSWRAESG